MRVTISTDNFRRMLHEGVEELAASASSQPGVVSPNRSMGGTYKLFGRMTPELMGGLGSCDYIQKICTEK